MRRVRLAWPPFVLLAASLVAPLLAQESQAVAPLQTRFDPRLDGMPFTNVGDYASPQGNCFGMSLLAIDNFQRRMRGQAAGQPAPQPLPVTRRPQDGHTAAQILASWVHAIAAAQDDGDNNPLVQAPPRDGRLMRAALERMRGNGLPEVMGTYARDGSAHAIVLFGYQEGRLALYDPNYPGETLRWPWDATRGLGPHPKGDAPLAKYEVGPFSAFRTSRQLQALRDACLQGLDRCVARFPQLRGWLGVTPQGQREVVGVIEGGLRQAEDGSRPHRPHRVWLVVDGTAVGSGRVLQGGRFRVRIPAGTHGVRLQVVATTAEGALAGANVVEGTLERATSK